MNNKALLFCLVIASMLMSIAPSQEIAIKLDGSIDKDEWKDAKEYQLAKGGKLLLKRDRNTLYLAMVTEEKGWAHVYLSKGDTISILHASAALGTAKYIRKQGSWLRVQPFEWRLRDAVFNEQTATRQHAYFMEYGWVANNNNIGKGMIFEFKIDLSAFKESPPSFACLVLADPAQPHYYPSTLNDDTLLPRLMQGNAPDSLQVNSSVWAKIPG